MTAQANQFDDSPRDREPLSPDPQSSGTEVAVSTLKFAGRALSPEQLRFNRLLERSETLARKIDAVRELADAHRIVSGSALRPLEVQRNALMRDMALWLDERLKRPGLTRSQKRMASNAICNLAACLVALGDEAMRALHDAHSDATLADQDLAVTSDTQAFLEQLLGEALPDGRHYSSLEDVLQASVEQLREQARAQHEERAAHKASRTSVARKRQKDGQAHDAQGALRAIYRQLASALHPDRETEPGAHARKTALMSEANAAYARRDLLALLQLQLRAELADAQTISTLAKEKVAALALLLKERVDVLTRELRDLESHTRAEFDLPPYLPFGANSLRRHLQEQKQDLQDDIAMMKRDFRRVRDDAEFKRWLREQDST